MVLSSVSNHEDGVMRNYEHTITVNLAPNMIFNAITQEMSNWWTGMTSVVKHVGDKTTAKFEDGTSWSFEVVTLQENKLIELHCYAANHIHPVTTPEMRNEWENTTLRFEIVPRGVETDIHFTHVGLTPEVNCYDICHSGWDHFFGSAFKAYLEKKIY